MSNGMIKVKTLFFVERNHNEIFVSEGFDHVKNEFFYRPIGGSVEFGETAKEALLREVNEETGKDIQVEEEFKVFECIFSFNGEKRHEVVYIFKGEFEDDEINNLDEFWLTESNGENVKCLWINKELFRKNRLKLVPEILVNIM